VVARERQSSSRSVLDPKDSQSRRNGTWWARLKPSWNAISGRVEEPGSVRSIPDRNPLNGASPIVEGGDLLGDRSVSDRRRAVAHQVIGLLLVAAVVLECPLERVEQLIGDVGVDGEIAGEGDRASYLGEVLRAVRAPGEVPVDRIDQTARQGAREVVGDRLGPLLADHLRSPKRARGLATSLPSNAARTAERPRCSNTRWSPSVMPNPSQTSVDAQSATSRSITTHLCCSGNRRTVSRTGSNARWTRPPLRAGHATEAAVLTRHHGQVVR